MTPEFLFAKLVDIGLVTVYYFFIGFILSVTIDKILGEFEEEEYTDVSVLQLAGEVILHLFFLGIVSYALRNLIELIPFPLEGFGGFEHVRLKEIQGGIVLSFVLLFFQKNLNDKILYFRKRAF